MNTKHYDLITIGDLNYDYLGNIPRFPQPDDEVEISEMQYFLGGSGANASVVATRLGLRCAFYSSVGRDSSGESLLRLLENEAVSTQFIQQIQNQKTGLCFGVISANGERRLFAYRGANLAFDSSIVTNSELQNASRLHLNGPLYSTAIDVMLRAKVLGVPVSIDPGSIFIEQHRDDMEIVYPLTDILFLNKVELRALTKDGNEEQCALELLNQGVHWLIIKKGDYGSILWQTGKDPLHCPAYKINAQDTTGAGDAFNAAFLFALIHNYSNMEILKFANAVGAMVASAVGATAGAPNSLQMVKDFINSYQKTS